jgi:osmotically inducible protein OsmC
MTELKRAATAVWEGDVRKGEGRITSESGALKHVRYSFGTRFEEELGSNPEELIAAAHAACFSMALANTLAEKGHVPEGIETRATCVLASQGGGGLAISRMILQVRGRVPGIEGRLFEQTARQADKTCPVSNLLRCGLEIELEATLV